MKALQGDGECKLEVVGEVQLTFSRDHHLLKFNGWVVNKLDEGILGRTPFQENNDIGTRVKKHLVTIRDDPYYYNHKSSHKPSTSFLVRNIKYATVWPCEEVKLDLPSDDYCLEPRYDVESYSWLSPCIVRSVVGQIALNNKTFLPVI